MLGRLDFFQA